MKTGLLLLFCVCAFAQERARAMRPWLQGRFAEAERQLAELAERGQLWDLVILWKAEFEIEQGHFDRAAAFIKDAKKNHFPGNEGLAERREARLLLATGRLAEAWQLALERRKWDGQDVRKLKVSSPLDLVTLGEVRLYRGAFAGALSIFEKARRSARSVSDDMGAEWLRAQNGIATAQLGLGSLQAASEAATTALSAAEREWGRTSIPATDATDVLGLILIAQSRLDEAEDSVSQALSRRVALYGRMHPKVAQSYLHMALVAAARKEPERAVVLVNQGLEVERALAAGPNGRWALALVSAAECLSSAGRGQEAAEYYRSAIPVLERELGPEAPRVVNARKQLSALTAR